ncbi:MAG: ribonuclease E/G [Alphaproteobacteria bacterium]|nr:ribonuclease E/G [Alphaproteobacteria bacterium]
MRRKLLIAAGPGEWRAVLLENDVPVELHVERGDSGAVGSAHLGRVVKRVDALGAVLVDIGDERPGFLPNRDILPEFGRLDEGGRVLVQVRREAQRGKAARLSTRFLRQPAADDEAGEWPAARRAAAMRLEPPMRLDPATGFAAALAARLPGVPQRVRADDVAIIPELRAGFPESGVEHAADLPVDIDALFETALAGTLALSGGGLVHIEEARAATVIDIDSGSPETGSPERAGLAVNLAAARVIAQQLRLRQIGGGVVIDFVGLEGRGPRDRVRAALAEAAATDPARPEILGWSRLGHLELVRPRRLRPLADVLLEPPPGGGLAKTAATIAFESLRALWREARQTPSANWRLLVSPVAAAALRGPAAAALRGLEGRLGRAVAISAEPGRPRDNFEIIPV